jgi:glycogen operon protein
MLSLGVPMLSGGDEVGRSQLGNNNGYCQDSPLTWTPWDVDEDSRAFLAFVQSLIAFRKAQPTLRRREFLDGSPDEIRDVLWVRPDGAEMTGPDWADPERHVLGVILDGGAIRERGPHGERVQSGTIAALFNAGDNPVIFMLPSRPEGELWEIVIDTATPPAAPSPLAGSQGVTVEPHAVVVLQASGVIA